MKSTLVAAMANKVCWVVLLYFCKMELMVIKNTNYGNAKFHYFSLPLSS